MTDVGVALVSTHEALLVLVPDRYMRTYQLCHPKQGGGTTNILGHCSHCLHIVPSQHPLLARCPVTGHVQDSKVQQTPVEPAIWHLILIQRLAKDGGKQSVSLFVCNRTLHKQWERCISMLAVQPLCTQCRAQLSMCSCSYQCASLLSGTRCIKASAASVHASRRCLYERERDATASIVRHIGTCLQQGAKRRHGAGATIACNLGSSGTGAVIASASWGRPERFRSLLTKHDRPDLREAAQNRERECAVNLALSQCGEDVSQPD